MQDIRKADVQVDLFARTILYLVPLNMTIPHQTYRSSDLLLLRASLGRENSLLQLRVDFIRGHLKLVSMASNEEYEPYLVGRSVSIRSFTVSISQRTKR